MVFNFLRQVLFDLRAGNSNLAKSLSEKKVTMQCTKTKTNTDAYYPCKINKTSKIFSYFSDLNTQN